MAFITAILCSNTEATMSRYRQNLRQSLTNIWSFLWEFISTVVATSMEYLKSVVDNVEGKHTFDGVNWAYAHVCVDEFN